LLGHLEAQLSKVGSKAKFDKSNLQLKLFEDPKHHLFFTPILTLLDPQKPFDIEIDALDYVFNAFLIKQRHPMVYHSETLFNTIK